MSSTSSKLVDKCFALLGKFPTMIFHENFRLKHSSNRVWSIQIGVDCRAFAFVEDTVFTWFWVGKHADYNMALEGPSCLFCHDDYKKNTLQVGKITGEHYWPAWIQQFVQPVEAKTKHTAKVLVKDKITGRLEFRTVDGGSRSGHDILHRKLDCVCNYCNQGWMHRLETSARPVLIPLLLGQLDRLKFNDIDLVCKWILKTTFVHEWAAIPAKRFVDDSDRWFDPDRFGTTKVFQVTSLQDRYKFYCDQEPPLDVYIWIARYSGHCFNGASHRTPIGAGVMGQMPIYYDAQIITSAIGGLVYTVVSTNSRSPNKGNIAPYLTQIKLDLGFGAVRIHPKPSVEEYAQSVTNAKPKLVSDDTFKHFHVEPWKHLPFGDFQQEMISSDSDYLDPH